MTRKDSIKVSALNLFVKQGYHGTSIRDICRAEEIKSPTIYTYFESKGELLLEVLKDSQKSYLEYLDPFYEEMVFEENSVEKKFFSFFQLNLKIYEQHTNEYILLFILNLYRRTDVNKEIMEQLHYWRDRVDQTTRKMLELGGKQEFYDDFMIEEISLAFFSFIHNYINLTKENNKELNHGRTRSMWNIYWDGMKSI